MDINVDLRQLRYFVAVAETLHFTQAATRLHVTQPALSRQVAALERTLAVRLFERQTRQVRLTAAGTQLLIDARAILAAVAQAGRNAQQAHAGERGTLRIGFMMHAAYGSVPRLTRRFLDAWPQVQLHLQETLPTRLADALLDGGLDAAVMFSPGATAGLERTVIYREPLCLAVPQEHPLAHEAATPDAARLAREPLIATPHEIAPSLRQAIDGYFAQAGATPVIRLETQLQQTIVSLVAEGIGVALVPQSLQRLGLRGVRFRPLAAAPVVEQVLAWASANRNPTLPHFLAVARACAPGAAAG